jgi:type IV pilus assembly protein PilZ
LSSTIRFSRQPETPRYTCLVRLLDGGIVKYPVSSSLRHKGKVIELDPAHEMIVLLGVTGDVIGSLSWDFVIDQILTYRKVPVQKEVRSEPRISLAFRVRYNSPEGPRFESRAGGIGGGGLFIESQTPLPVGTRLAMEFSLPEKSEEWMPAKGTVAWVCPKADQYTFSPGMGIRFTEIAEDVRDRIHELVKSIQNIDQAA